MYCAMVVGRGSVQSKTRCVDSVSEKIQSNWLLKHFHPFFSLCRGGHNAVQCPCCFLCMCFYVLSDEGREPNAYRSIYLSIYISTEIISVNRGLMALLHGAVLGKELFVRDI